MISAQTVSEQITQATLSSFHTSKKSGEELTLSSEKINMKYLQLTKQSSDNIVVMTSLSEIGSNNILNIKRSLEYCNLELLNYRLIINETSNASHINLIVDIDKERMTLYNIDITDVEKMIVINTNSLSYIAQSQISIISQNSIELKVRFISNSSLYKSLFNVIFPFFHKGFYSNNRFTHTKIKLFDGSIQSKMIFELADISLLSNFDTSQIQISIPIEILHRYISVASTYSTLSNTYISSGLQYNHFRQMALYQCRGMEPTKFKKHLDMNLMSKMAFQTSYADLQNSVTNEGYSINRRNNSYSIAESIFLARPIQIGTGYYRTSTDITPYTKLKVIKKEKEIINELVF
jgi:hypothetical protein